MDRTEYAVVCGDGSKGEGRGERPSDISVLDDSAPGDVFFHVKKLVILLLLGVLGTLVSIEFVVKDLVRGSGRGKTT